MRGDSWSRLAKLLAGDGHPLGARSQALREVLEPCVGARPDDLEVLDPPEAGFGLRPVRVAHRERQRLLDGAQEVLDGLLAKEIERLEPHLADTVTVLWPDGQLRRHPKGPLLERLEAAPGEPAPVILRDPRTYSPAELRAVRPRGEAELLVGASEAPTIAVTLGLDSRRGSRGRALLWAALEGGAWRFSTLALPSPDDVVVVGQRASSAEDEAIRVADKVVRHWLLGHSGQLRAIRNHMMGKLWLGEEIVTAEALIADRGERALDGYASWFVHLGTTREDFELSATMKRDLERRAKEAWKRPWNRLKPAWLVSKVGVWNPQTRKPERERRIRTMALEVEDVDARDEVSRRWRLAGLFDPDLPAD